MKRITVTLPMLPDLDEFHDMLKEIWAIKWVTNIGQFHEQLEKALAEYLKVPYISLFSNGTIIIRKTKCSWISKRKVICIKTKRPFCFPN